MQFPSSIWKLEIVAATQRVAGGLAFLVSVMFILGCASTSEPKRKNTGMFQANDRVVCLGDSITDGDTYPLLLAQAMRDAGMSPAVFINAGVGGDTIAKMRARLERDVLAHEPDVVLISAGANDASQQVTADSFREDLMAIVNELQGRQIQVMLLTPTPVGPKHEKNRARLAEYEQIMSDVAINHWLTCVNITRAFCEGDGFEKPRLELFSADQLHLNFAGYRVFARKILDAAGYSDVPVPEELKLQLLPGVIRDWQVRPIDHKALPLNEKKLTRLANADEGWTAYTLPEDKPHDDWWPDQERQRGFAMRVSEYVGRSKAYVGRAVIDSDEPRHVLLHTGAQLQAIWLNGKEIFRQVGWTGFHAGKERVPATLRAGRNEIVIEFPNMFFLSVVEAGDSQ